MAAGGGRPAGQVAGEAAGGARGKERGRRGGREGWRRLTVRQRVLQQQQAEEHPEPHGESGRGAGLRRGGSGDGGGPAAGAPRGGAGGCGEPRAGPSRGASRGEGAALTWPRRVVCWALLPAWHLLRLPLGEGVCLVPGSRGALRSSVFSTAPHRAGEGGRGGPKKLRFPSCLLWSRAGSAFSAAARNDLLCRGTCGS